MPFCPHCGNAVTSPFCPVCGGKTAVTPQPQPQPSPTSTFVSSSGQTIGVAGKETAHRPDSELFPTNAVVFDPAVPDGFFRTPLQILILSYATFGIYGVYYLIRGRRLAEIRLEEERTSYWWYLFWLIPIVGVVSGIMCASKMQRRVAITGFVKSSLPFGLFAFCFFLFQSLWRIPDSWGYITFLSSIFIAAIHINVAKAERFDFPSHAWPKFSAWEWVIAIGGGLLFIFATTGAFIDVTRSETIFMAVIVFVVLLSLLFANLAKD